MDATVASDWFESTVPEDNAIPARLQVLRTVDLASDADDLSRRRVRETYEALSSDDDDEVDENEDVLVHVERAPAAREAYLRTKYPDAWLDPAYTTATLDYLVWRDLLEFARQRGRVRHERCHNAISGGEHTPHNAGVRRFLAAVSGLAVFSKVRITPEVEEAYSAAVDALRAVREDPTWLARTTVARRDLELAVLHALPPDAQDKVMGQRRTVLAGYRSQRAEAEAEALYESGSVNARDTAYDAMADAYERHTRFLAGHRGDEPEDPAAVRAARRRIKGTPWSGAVKPRQLRGQWLADFAWSEAAAAPHPVFGTSRAIVAVRELSLAYTAALYAVRQWKDASLLFGTLDYDYTKNESHVAWDVVSTVRFYEGDVASVTADGREFWLVRPGLPSSTTATPSVRPPGPACLEGWRRTVRKGRTQLQPCGRLVLPEGALPLGLEVRADLVVVHFVGGTFVFVPRAPETGALEAADACTVTLPLASCFCVDRTEAGRPVVWVGDEVGFAVQLTLPAHFGPARRSAKHAKPPVVEWSRTISSGDVERITQVQARGPVVATLTRHALSTWGVPDAPGAPALWAPSFLQVPDTLSVALHGTQVALVDRLGAVRLLDLRSNRFVCEFSALYKHLVGPGRQYVTGEHGGASGAGRCHLQWAPNGAGFWVVYPSGAAVLHAAFAVGEAPPPPVVDLF